MELTLALFLSIISCLIGVFSFFFNRKDKSNKDVETSSYNQGKIDEKLRNIMEKLDNIQRKIDGYDQEMEMAINKAIKLHEELYHGQKGA